MSAEPMREVERRKLSIIGLNIMESLIVAALVGLGALIFSMRETLIKLQVTQETTNQSLTALQSQLADVPALATRVSRLEVRTESLEEQAKELRQVRDLR